MNEQRTSRRERNRDAFTLIEVLLVVAILGILAGVVVVNFSKHMPTAMIRTTRTSIANVCLAIDTYQMDTGRLPPSLQSLVSNDGAPNWNGPYVRGGLPNDAWGTPLGYTPKENDYEVRSAGLDTQMGTADDIINAQNETK